MDWLQHSTPQQAGEHNMLLPMALHGKFDEEDTAMQNAVWQPELSAPECDVIMQNSPLSTEAKSRSPGKAAAASAAAPEPAHTDSHR